MSTAAETAPRGSWVAVRNAVPLLCSVGLLLAGSGLAATLLGVRAAIEGFRPSVIGVVLAGYYVGFVGGSLFAPAAIDRVGHVRVFAGLAALASAALLLHAVIIDPFSWFVLRVIVGLCISALYVVAETWLNGVTTNRSRGGVFAIYMVVTSAALLGGQFGYAVLGPRGFEPFIIASVLVSLAVVPVSLAAFPAPAARPRTPVSVRRIATAAPLALVGAVCAGFIAAAMLGAGVVYANEAGFNRSATAAFVGAALFGGALLQVPLGRWSDRVDRRFVLAVTAIVAAAVAVIASQVAADRRLILIGLTVVAGGSAFPVYSLSVAHLNDYIDDDLKVAAGAKVVLVNGIGSVAGPVAGSAVVGLISPGSLYLVLAGAYALVGSYSLYRMFRRVAAVEEERASFAPVVAGVGPTSVVSGETDFDERYPIAEGDAPFDDLVVHYVERGTGPPVVLIGDVEGAEGDVWDELPAPLAADGFRAVAPFLGSGHDPDDDAGGAVLALMRHLAVPSATFVGYGTGVRVAQRLAEDNGDRTDALVLLVEADAVDDIDVEAEVLHPTLRLDRTLLAASPSDVADDIAQFVRPVAATIAVQWETGQFEAVATEQ